MRWLLLLLFHFSLLWMLLLLIFTFFINIIMISTTILLLLSRQRILVLIILAHLHITWFAAHLWITILLTIIYNLIVIREMIVVMTANITTMVLNCFWVYLVFSWGSTTFFRFEVILECLLLRLTLHWLLLLLILLGGCAFVLLIYLHFLVNIIALSDLLNRYDLLNCLLFLFFLYIHIPSFLQ